jgi:hypothetical protein
MKGQRARDVRKALSNLDAVLGLRSMTTEEYLQSSLDASGIDGVGGLTFQVAAPPGRGRLIRLPFYPTTVPTGALTGNGLDVASSTNPVVIIPVGLPLSGILSGFVFTTPQIEWARMRLVGFQQLSLYAQVSSGLTRSSVMVRDLRVGGGANLLPQEGYQSAEVFTSRVPEIAGLRDYPLIESPNTASVRAAVSGASGGRITFSLWGICEILDDSTFGKTIPGPYARAGALRRIPNPQGDAYVAS